MRKSLTSLAIAVPALAASPGFSQIPPPVTVEDSSASNRLLLRWMPGDVRCGDTVIPASLVRRPWTSLGWRGGKPGSQTYAFRIDATGRPLSITRQGADFAPGTDDIAPSLAASRFAGGGERRDCRISYTAELLPFAEAPVGDLVSYSVNPMNGPLPKAGWDRIRPSNGDCDKEPRAGWLVNVLPDFRKVPAEPGARDWSLVGYDLDRRGRPTNVRLATGTGNRALDKAAVEALSRSRQTEGPRRGCFNPYWRNATRLPAPPTPDPDPFRPSGSTCPAGGGWARWPVLVFPEPWRRRAIEGWAIVVFDVAPWGGIGNARAVASEPAADFGTAAVRIISSSTKPASGTGATGCVERVVFKMGPGTPE